MSISLFPLKQNNGSVSPTKQVKKLKIELTDKNFELKKIQQDFAENKAHMIMQYNTQKVNFKKTIEELKQKIMFQNEHWTNKVDEIRQNNKKNIQLLNNEWKIKTNNQINLIKQRLQEQYGEHIKELKNRLKIQQQKNKEDCRKYYQQKIKIQEQENRKIQQIKKQYQDKLEFIQKQNKKEQQSKINALMHVRNLQDKKNRQTKQMFKKKQQQYKQTIQKYQTIMSLNKSQISSFKDKISKSKSEIQGLNVKISQIINQNKVIIQQKQTQYKQDIQNKQKQWKQNIQSLNIRWKLQHKRLHQILQKIQNSYKQKQKIWEERGQKVLQLFQKRQSKEQDVKTIQHLQVQLIRKQLELQRQKQERKVCKLELDNMDQLYKRIFYSAQKSHQRTNSFQTKKVRLPGIINKSTIPVKNNMATVDF